MKIKFPCYNTSFICDCTLQEATERIFKAVNWESNNLKLLNATYSGVQKIIISASTGSILYHNSFLPITTVEIREENEASRISMRFELKKSVKVFMVIYCVILALFEIAMSVEFLSDLLAINSALNISSLWPLLLPLGMFLFCCVLSSIGLKVSSKGVLDILFYELTQGSKDKLPPIHKL